MTRKTKLCKASNGLFVRNIGWKRTSTGYAQHKFYLGGSDHQGHDDLDRGPSSDGGERVMTQINGDAMLKMQGGITRIN